MIEIVQKAADNVGGLVKLSRELGIKHTAMYSWKRVPAGRVLDIERLSGISRYEIRPDIFGPTKTIERKTRKSSVTSSGEVAA